MADISVKITEHFGVISTKKNGWTREINRVEWDGRAGKIDIREWDATHERMSRGLTFTDEEAKCLRDILNVMFE